MSRNKAIYVTGLHMILQLTARCIQTGHQINIIFVNNSLDFANAIKTSERILWVEYGACLDTESFEHIFDPKLELLVFPAVKEGINWDAFKENINTGSKEANSQAGLDFDTEVGKETGDCEGMYTVKSSTPVVWVFDCKSADKLRDRKGEGVKIPRDIPDFVKKCVEKGVKVRAYTKANVLVHYTHEAVGNILEAVGISTKQG